MNRQLIETLGVRYTGRAALDRDPQEDLVEFICPNCGQRGTKSARRDRTRYHFTDGFVQDLEGELTTCRGCRRASCWMPRGTYARSCAAPRTSGR